MPMIPKAGGGETYSMNPQLGNAIEKAKSAEMGATSQSTSLLFVQSGDGSPIKCTVTRDGGAPEVQELPSVDDAKNLLDQEFGDKSGDEAEAGDQGDGAAKNTPPGGGSQL